MLPSTFKQNQAAVPGWTLENPPPAAILNRWALYFMNASETLYKFRTWTDEFHKRCLTHNEYYFAPPSQINDPFECTNTIDFSLLDNEAKIETFASEMIKQSLIDPNFNIQNIGKQKAQIIQRLKTNPSSFQQMFDKLSLEKVENNYGILSLANRWDCIPMWAHYANNHTGFCIGLNKANLESLATLGISGLVLYSESFPKINPLKTNVLEHNIRQVNTKSIDWKYEAEFRFTNIFDTPNPTANTRTVKIPDNCISEVIIGLKTPSADLNKIKKIADQKNLPVFKIVKKERSFLFDKVQI